MQTSFLAGCRADAQALVVESKAAATRTEAMRDEAEVKTRFALLSTLRTTGRAISRFNYSLSR
jgi:hypothetical protein